MAVKDMIETSLRILHELNFAIEQISQNFANPYGHPEFSVFQTSNLIY